MLLAISLAFATQLKVEIMAPDGSHAAATADVSGPVVLTRYPIAIGSAWTALVSAKNADLVTTVDIEIYKGDWRKGRRIMNPKLVVTSYETSYNAVEATEPGGKRRWAVSARVEESIDKPPTADGLDRTPTTSAPGMDGPHTAPTMPPADSPK